MGTQAVTNAVVVTQTTMTPDQTPMQLALFNAAGTPLVPLATPAAAQTDVATMTSAAATGGDAPTEAEYNALRVDAAATRTVVNSLLAKLRTAGIVLP